MTGTSTYELITATRSGGTFQVPLSELAPGTYDYIAEVFQNTAESPTNETQESGQFVVTASTASISSQTVTPAYLSGVAVSGNNLTWAQAVQSGGTLQVELESGSGVYTQLSASSSNGTNYSASFNGIASGTYTYYVNYLNSAGATYLQGKGTISITTTTTSTSASATMGAPTQVLPVAGLSQTGNGILTWTSAANAGDAVTFQYSTPGSGTWTSITPQLSGGIYQVNLSGLSGEYDFEIDYTAQGAGAPYRVADGSFGVTHTTTGTTTDTTRSTLNAKAQVGYEPIESQTVDRWGNVISFTNESGQTTNYTYNRYNEMTQETDPSITAVSVRTSTGTAGTTTAVTGTVSTTTSATPVSSNYYDLYGRLIGTMDGDGNINGETYNAANQVISEQHADGGQVGYVYDSFGDQIQVTNYVNSSTKYLTRNAYDQAGRLTDTEQELVAGTFTGAATGFSSSLLPAATQNVIRQTYTYDESGRRITSTDGAGDTTYYTYDLHGNVTSTKTPLGETTTYVYNLENEKTSEKDPDANTQSWAYNAGGQVTSHVDLGGTTYIYTYDYNTTSGIGSGVLDQITSSGDQFGGENKVYSYNSANYLTEINDTGVNSASFYSYDAAGRIDHEWTIRRTVHTG